MCLGTAVHSLCNTAQLPFQLVSIKIGFGQVFEYVDRNKLEGSRLNSLMHGNFDHSVLEKV